MIFPTNFYKTYFRSANLSYGLPAEDDAARSSSKDGRFVSDS